MLRCLGDTCTSLKQYKFEDIMILNKDFSKLYYTCKEFRQKFLDYKRKIKAKYPQFKFGLNLHDFINTETLHDIFEDVYYIDLSYAKKLIDITPLKDIPIVKLSHIGNKKDLSKQMINYIDLDWYYNTKKHFYINSFISLAFCTTITNFSSLKGLLL